MIFLIPLEILHAAHLSCPILLWDEGFGHLARRSAATFLLSHSCNRIGAPAFRQGIHAQGAAPHSVYDDYVLLDLHGCQILIMFFLAVGNSGWAPCKQYIWRFLQESFYMVPHRLDTLLEQLSVARMVLFYVATYALACSLLQPLRPLDRSWSCRPAAVGDEEVCRAMRSAPVGTRSGGEPLAHHVSFAALLWHYMFLVLNERFTVFPAGFLDEYSSLTRFRPLIGCRGHEVLTASASICDDGYIPFHVLVARPGPKSGGRQNFLSSITTSRFSDGWREGSGWFHNVRRLRYTCPSTARRGGEACG